MGVSTTHRDQLPRFTGVALEHAFATELPELAISWQAAAAPNPQPVVVNSALADELGIDLAELSTPTGTEWLVGRALADGGEPVAQVYAGHQFGAYSPRLGDGRALLLGEIRTPDGRLVDVHLKGSGRTPLARADGFAALGPMLREYLMSEAMHALGVATTRSLAVVTTGATVLRDDFLHDNVVPAAVLTRIASSHLRVGSFQFVKAQGDLELLERLVEFAIERHYAHLQGAERSALGLFREVVKAQADLVAQWMLVGFVHGVMNTDNMTISGETIDYGPCAFIDAYDLSAVFSSIDHAGRYAFGSQPAIAKWDLARFAEALLPLLARETRAEGQAVGGGSSSNEDRASSAQPSAASTADSAGTADGAGTADSAGRADSAGTAEKASTADSAGRADGAGTADSTGRAAIELAQKELAEFDRWFYLACAAGMAAKLGLGGVADEQVRVLSQEFFDLLADGRVDYTNAFRRLTDLAAAVAGQTATDATRTDATRTEPTRTEPTRTDATRTDATRTKPTRTEPAGTEPAPAQPADIDATATDATATDSAGPGETATEFIAAEAAALELLSGVSGSNSARAEAWLDTWKSYEPNADLMRRANPVTIPRNHLLEDALNEATGGNMQPFNEMLAAVSHPFDDRPEWERFAEPAPPEAGRFISTCGT